ncbi:WecB/TagA/CpsF family glycosyltransferase [Brevundimonas sp.]|uniref:WecB/TagA/CpsF family glycosyltransferase n=1 Tax=Brevundimonas sp. TaxID=1871086 RepID=UPI003BAC1AAD
MADSTHFRISAAAPDRREQTRTRFRKARRPQERVHLMGQLVDLVKPEEVLHHMERWILERRKVIIANHNLNSIYLLSKTPEMREFYERADLVELDSTPLVHFAKLLGLKSKGFHRCTYLDWRDHFWSLVNRNAWRIMYVGGTAEVGQIAAERLGARYPRARIVTQHGYFDATPGSDDNERLIGRIAAYNPHVLFVGMGMPRQEIWISQNLDALPDCAIFSVGAAFDYEAGAQKSAPRWMGRMGVEWLYRLVKDPKRLYRRYCIEPWSLMPLAFADLRTAFAKKRTSAN